MKNIEIIRNESATAAEKLTAIISTTTNSRHPAEDAKKLLEKFGSIANVIESPADALAQITGKATAEKLAAILPIMRLYEREKTRDPEKIANSRDLEAYCKSLVMGEQTESFYIIAVNSQCHVLGARKISQGDIAEVSAYPRQIARAAQKIKRESVTVGAIIDALEAENSAHPIPCAEFSRIARIIERATGYSFALTMGDSGKILLDSFG